MSNDDDTHVDASDAEEILERAVELAGEEQAEEASRVSLEELERAAAEVGVPAEAVARAAQEQKARRTVTRLLLLLGVLAVACTGLAGMLLLVVSSRPEDADRAQDATVEEPGLDSRSAAPRSAGSRDAGPAPADVAPPTRDPIPSPSQDSDTVEEGQPAPSGDDPGGGGVSPPPSPPPSAPGAPEAGVGGAPLSGEAVARAQTAVTGSWQLVAWVGAKGQPLEVPVSARSDGEAAAEVWHFLSGGRFRRTIGGDFAVSGRWSVMSEVSAPEGVQWVGAETWWLVALDQVQVLALPGQIRPREWALVGMDGEERIIFYLGAEPDLAPSTLGARSVRGTPEGARR